MDGNRFYLCLWALAAAVVSVLIVAIALSEAHFDDLLAKAPDPVALACAAKSSDSHVCIAYAGRKTTAP